MWLRLSQHNSLAARKGSFVHSKQVASCVCDLSWVRPCLEQLGPDDLVCPVHSMCDHDLYMLHKHA